MKKRGRPPGSKNKPKISEPTVEFEEPQIAPLPPPPPPGPTGGPTGIEAIPEQPKLKRSSPRKPKRVPPASPRGQPVEETRQPTSLDLAANMLNLLRLEQAERQQRKAELYRSWVK